MGEIVREREEHTTGVRHAKNASTTVEARKMAKATPRNTGLADVARGMG